ncbi:hypothetical protein CLV31_106203 [Algoriphagus aquaeductus]|uniref:RHH-type rel operon transcriptional repressor/antitoxin RelB n=1 Tax=Algoriphagus aquaeductus TaxID=475299 RepID=A0A326S1Q3_9BACT|nr:MULTISPECIES: hypothetical protein [Algoriphagus]PZV83586.1 hypothetical protein CLV31_106203 [Algoriphagus aquaeductus]
MKKIEIQVNKEALDLYQSLDSKEKERFEESVLQLLAIFNRSEIDRYERLRNEMAKEAGRKGITEEELDRLLKLED